jgi:hypothetical protein
MKWCDRKGGVLKLLGESTLDIHRWVLATCYAMQHTFTWNVYRGYHSVLMLLPQSWLVAEGDGGCVTWETREGGVEEEQDEGQGQTQSTGEDRGGTGGVLRARRTHAPPASRPRHTLATHMDIESMCEVRGQRGRVTQWETGVQPGLADTVS